MVSGKSPHEFYHQLQIIWKPAFYERVTGSRHNQKADDIIIFLFCFCKPNSYTRPSHNLHPCHQFEKYGLGKHTMRYVENGLDCKAQRVQDQIYEVQLETSY